MGQLNVYRSEVLTDLQLVNRHGYFGSLAAAHAFTIQLSRSDR